MSKQPYMKLWVADFLGDTLHLSDAEVGQYILLLMAMWRNGGKLPKNKSFLARVARNHVSPNVLKFFNIDDATASIWQKRLSCELSASRAFSEKQSSNAKARWLKNKEKADATALPEACLHSHSHNNIYTPKPKDELLSVLDADRAEGVIEHRKKLRKPLSLRAARLLAKQLAKFPEPNAAADEMILRGWQSIKPEWLQDKSASRKNGSGYYVKVGSSQAEAWRRYANKHNDGNLIYKFRGKAEGDEVYVPAEWPPR